MLIIEGIDGVGKTTLVEYLQSYGMKKFHFDYDSKNMDLLPKYMNVLSLNDSELVLDRSFISEMVYGPVMRNTCKLNVEDYTKLLIAYKTAGAKIIYLTAPKDVLLKRRNDDKDAIPKCYQQKGTKSNRPRSSKNNTINRKNRASRFKYRYNITFYCRTKRRNRWHHNDSRRNSIKVK